MMTTLYKEIIGRIIEHVYAVVAPLLY